MGRTLQLTDGSVHWNFLFSYLLQALENHGPFSMPTFTGAECRVEDHIRCYDFKRLESDEERIRALEKVRDDMVCHEMDPSQPLWRMVLVSPYECRSRTALKFSENVSVVAKTCIVTTFHVNTKHNIRGDKGASTIFFQFHHCLGDGISISSIFLAHVIDSDEALETDLRDRIDMMKRKWTQRSTFEKIGKIADWGLAYLQALIGLFGNIIADDGPPKSPFRGTTGIQKVCASHPTIALKKKTHSHAHRHERKNQKERNRKPK